MRRHIPCHEGKTLTMKDVPRKWASESANFGGPCELAVALINRHNCWPPAICDGHRAWSVGWRDVREPGRLESIPQPLTLPELTRSM
jgi:hypothetical protein